MTAPPFALTLPNAPELILSGPRVGITKASERPWRYGLAGSPYLSRPIRTRA
jgi:DNA-3-methyladenine glycosylase